MQRNKKIKTIICALIIVFGLSFINLPKTFADDSSYFNVEGSTLYPDILFPSEDPEIAITVKAAKAMKLYGMEMHFTPTHPDGPSAPGDKDLTLRGLSTEHPQMNGNEHSLFTGLLTWNIEGDDTWDDRDYIDVEPGDVLFEAKYLLESDARSLMRDFPLTVDVAYIGDENGITETLRNIAFPVKVYVVSNGNPNVLSIHKIIEGNGTFFAPNLIAEGENLHIDFAPDEGNEVRYAYINGYYLEEEELKNNSFDIVAIDKGYPYYEIRVGFQPVYEIEEGDGSEYVVGSGENLSFKVNADLENFHGTGLVGVDDRWISAIDEWTVNPETGTVSLLSDFLGTLELGEHSLELVFSYPEIGVARATFTIVDQSEEGGDTPIPVPNTGTFTGADGGAQTTIEPTIITAILITTIGIFYYKKSKQSVR